MIEEWVETTLGDVVESLDSKRKPVKSIERKKGPFPYYGASGIVDYVDDWIFEGEALLVSEDGANLRARTTPIAFCVAGRYWVNNHAHVLRAVHGTDNRFLAHYLESINIDSSLTGTTMPKLNAANLLKISILLPPLPVQRRIVDLMTHLDAHIANMKAEQNALSSVLRNYRLVTFTRITSEWPAVKLGDTVESLDSMRRPVKSADRVSGPYPYYGASGVVDFVNDWIFEGQTLLVSEDGANLRARSSPIAFCADGRYWVNNHAHVLRALDTTTNDYLAQYLECTDIDLALTGTTMPKLNAANLLRIEVPLPPLSMQRDFTESLERLSASITASQCESQRLEELRTALLEGLLVGSIEIPSDYDSLLIGEVA